MDTFGLSAAQLESAGARFTVAEILQQPEVWADVISLVEQQMPSLTRAIGSLLDRADVHVVLTGAGTSAHIGACVAPAASRALGRRVEAVPSTDLVADPQSHLSADAPTLLVSFGRSGNSPESIAALDVAEAYLKRCFHLIITCDAAGALYRRAQDSANAYAILLPERSNDRSFAMTSSFSGMALAAALALRVLRPDIATGIALSRAARQIIPERISLLHTLIGEEFERVVYLGSKEFQGLARESALKMLEMTDGKVVAVAESPLGFRHGPKTVLNRNTLVIVYVSNDDYTRQYDLDLIDELRRDAVAGRVMAISGRPLRTQHADNVVVETTVSSDQAADLELCLPFAMLAQSLALLRSLSLGVRPDNPNAAGTVSRVVKGVTIHPWRGAV
jgi:tagatose-6-phosphate ketose/aldose isomerase